MFKKISLLTIAIFILSISFQFNAYCENSESNLSFVKKLYRQHLNREPDKSGIKTWVGGLDSGKLSKKEVLRGILGSEEYYRLKKKRKEKKSENKDKNIRKNKDDSNEEFVRKMYRVFLKREVDPSGLKTYAGGLDSGKLTRKQVVNSITNSDEYRKIKGKKKEKEVETSSTSLDDLYDRMTNNENTKTDSRTSSKAESKKFGPKSSGIIEFETSGIQHQNNKCANGDWEYIFFTLRGKGMRRLLLLHAGGSGRAIRYVLQCDSTDTMRMEIASDNLPDWHKWTVKWGNGEMKVFLDGKQIGRTEKFNGTPDKCIIGGNENSRRNFLGSWRNFTVK